MTQSTLAGLGNVITVDERDRVIGSCPKLTAHQTGVLHRAVSVFVVSPDGSRLLLQRRALHKYHSGGLWSNTACSHPVPGERAASAARRCLREEMGLSVHLWPLYVFRYRADVGNGLLENEVDHVFWGTTTNTPSLTPAEVAEWRWEATGAIIERVRATPDQFTVWFSLCCQPALKAIQQWRRSCEVPECTSL